MRHYGGYLIILALMMPLASCDSVSGLFSSDHTKPAHKPVRHAKATKNKQTYDAATFVMQLSLSRLSLAANASPADISANLDTIQAYEAQRKANPEKLQLVVLEYKVKGGRNVEQVVAPVSAGGSEFPSLQAVFNKLNATPNTLQNIRLVEATVVPDRSLVLSEEAAPLKIVLDDQQRRLLENAGKLPLADDIRAQLALLRFFIDQRFRDAAYFTGDNVKRALAEAARSQSLDEATLTGFSDQLQALESRLHAELPYKL